MQQPQNLVDEHLLLEGPAAPIAGSELLRFPLRATGTGYVAEFTRQVEELMSGLMQALNKVSNAAQTEPISLLSDLDDETYLRELIAILSSFPADAVAGHMKVAGLVPKTKNRANAKRFMALTLLYATQIIFEGRNKGLDNFHTAAWTRLESKETFSESDLLLLRGFRGLYQLITSDNGSSFLSQFASVVWHAFPPNRRKVGAIGASYMLLKRMGQSWSE